MADADSFTSKPQKVGSSKIQENHPNPSKFYNQFLYKALIVSLFLVLLPLFPSQAPEFINQTLHTRSWELLQLIFVGIAVSYGLFSKRNEEPDKDNNNNSSKFDNAQSYLSRLLHVSSVYDDESDNLCGTYDNKVQTWNSQYYRGEPEIVVAPDSSVLEENKVTTTSQVDQKPLLLPIRSLKSRVPDPDDVVESSNIVSNLKGGSLSRSSSNLGSRHFSRNSSGGEFGGLEEENNVLRSPIPWRSRSGRMEMKEDLENPSPYALPPSMDESKLKRLDSKSLSFNSQSSRSFRTSSLSQSPKNLSPSSPSLSSESLAKNAEDLGRRKIYHKQTPPPPPPPPPPPLFYSKPPLAKSNSDGFFPRKELKRSFKSVPDEFSGIGTDDMLNNREKLEAEWRASTSIDGSAMGRKSVQTLGAIESFQLGAAKAREFSEDYVNYKDEKSRRKESEAKFNEKTSFPLIVPKEEKKDFFEHVLMETDEEDSDTTEDEFEEMAAGNEEGASSNTSASDGGGPPDVDKKADEFIAKFREQIRLQRIASIRRSTGQQISRNSVR